MEKIKNIGDLIMFCPEYKGMTPAKLVDHVFKKKGYDGMFKIVTDGNSIESEFKGFSKAKKALINYLRNGSTACLIGPPGTGKTYMTQVLGKSLSMQYHSGDFDYRWNVSDCPVREDAYKTILFKKSLEVERMDTVFALYGTMCPNCKKGIENVLGKKIADVKRNDAKKIEETKVIMSEFMFIDYDFSILTDGEQARYELLYRPNLETGLAGAPSEESISMGLCADNFTLIVFNEAHRPINEYGQEVVEPLFKLLEKSAGKEISTPAGVYPVDILPVFNMNGGVDADLAMLRRIGMNFIPINYPGIETEIDITKQYISQRKKALNTFGVGATQSFAVIQAMDELGNNNGFHFYCPEETVEYIAFFAQATRPSEWCREDSFNNQSLFDYMDKLSAFARAKGGAIDFLTVPDTGSVIIGPILTQMYDEYNSKEIKNTYDGLLRIPRIDERIDEVAEFNGWKSADAAKARARALLITKIEEEVFGESPTSFKVAVDLEEIKKEIEANPIFLKFIKEKLKSIKESGENELLNFSDLKRYYIEILVG